MATSTLSCGCAAHCSSALCPVAEKIARHYASRFFRKLPRKGALEYGDFLAVALGAAWRAQERFCATAGASFNTWVSGCTWNALQDFLRAEDHLKRTTRKGRTEEELPPHLGTPLSLETAMVRMRERRSECGGQGEMDLLEVLFPVAVFHDRDGMTEGLRIAEVRGLLRYLSRPQRKVMLLLYWQHFTAKDVAQVLGRCESRVSQIHREALDRLREVGAVRLEGGAS